MNPKRFSFALERLASEDWDRFERLSSAFLAPEFPELRTLAATSGDGGRDGELFSPRGDAAVALQYSVTRSWERKIIDTAKLLHDNFPAVSILIYVTCQLITAQADDIRIRLRKEYRINLDVRDRSWFVDRVNTDYQREAAAELLAKEIVEPYLASQDIVRHRAHALNSLESRTAFVFLGLQLEDDTREKGLTRLSYEALVRATLRETDSEHRLSRNEVHRRVQAMLPNHPPEIVRRHTESALRQLTKKYIRHWQAQDEFCLTHEEVLRIQDRLIDIEQADGRLHTEIMQTANAAFPDVGLAVLDEVVSRVRRILETYLFNRGELFVSTITTGVQYTTSPAELITLIERDVAAAPLSGEERELDIADVGSVVTQILLNPGEEVRRHLRSMADAYTLLAFLRETPDVQKVVSKIFSSGEIWLDTNVILYLLAEELVAEDRRQFSAMIHAATAAGIHFHITAGVLEEIESHMNLSLTCARMTSHTWEGNIPFLYSVFVRSGWPVRAFPSWLERFKGDARPADDIADYLRDTNAIEVVSLENEIHDAPQELKLAVQVAWQQRHEARRQRSGMKGDALTAVRLASHDVENYLGVLQRRRQEPASPLGYNSWWLTLDSAAFDIARSIQAEFRVVSSPVMSPDFLTNYLAIGPIRNRVASKVERLLPVAIQLQQTEAIPSELLDVAEKVREQYQGHDEHVIRRKVRDALDAAKRRRGKLAIAGLQTIEDELFHST